MRLCIHVLAFNSAAPRPPTLRIELVVFEVLYHGMSRSTSILLKFRPGLPSSAQVNHCHPTIIPVFSSLVIQIQEDVGALQPGSGICRCIFPASQALEPLVSGASMSASLTLMRSSEIRLSCSCTSNVSPSTTLTTRPYASSGDPAARQIESSNAKASSMTASFSFIQDRPSRNYHKHCHPNMQSARRLHCTYPSCMRFFRATSNRCIVFLSASLCVAAIQNRNQQQR